MRKFRETEKIQKIQKFGKAKKFDGIFGKLGGNPGKFRKFGGNFGGNFEINLGQVGQREFIEKIVRGTRQNWGKFVAKNEERIGAKFWISEN